MKTIILLAAALLAAAAPTRTLRVDYIFSGTGSEAGIAVAELRSIDGWAGRRVNMDSLALKGNGQITLRRASDGKVLYRNSFSTLFQEWQNTEEATRVRRAFENVFLLPMPEEDASVTVELFDSRGRVSASLTHPVSPSDILIRPVAKSKARVTELRTGGSVEECINVVIVAEGYAPSESELFLGHAREAVDAILSHSPFREMKNKFNFRAVEPPVSESGVSVPREGIWKETPFHSGFDTFYTERYLTTLHLRDLHDALAGIPYEHIIILANTDVYGGGGIFNSYTLTTARHKLFKPVVVHEFGHSFAGLADEYYYDDQFSDYYPPCCEPWEQNITTFVDFKSKWEDMLGKDGVSVLEGGGYKSKGVWRACPDCRMHTNGAPGFCPVCRRAIERLIRFYTEEGKSTH